MKKSVCILIIAAIVLSLPLFTSCGIDDRGEYSIVCAMFVQYDFCRVITEGTDVKLTLLQKNGTDMHSFEPTSTDIMAIADCDLFVYNGGESDTWVEGAVRSSGNKDMTSVSLFGLVELRKEEELQGVGGEDDDHDHESEPYDEHIWTSPKNAIKIVEGLCDILCREKPEYAEKFRENTDAYNEKLGAVDREFEEIFKEPKTLIFADRFPFLYFVKDYNISYYAAFPGCSTEENASFETVMFLTDKVKETGADAVYRIDGSNGSIADRIAKETGVRVVTLYSCQSVTVEDMERGESYLSYMNKNLEALRGVGH